MDTTNIPRSIDSGIVSRGDSHPHSAICWGSILGGATAAAALSLILLALGAGLGLSSISPMAYNGVSSSTLGIAAIVWLMVMSGMASGLGGYIAGRLRTKWRDAGGDELFFRDTAHGFLAWAVATLVSAAFLSSAATSMVGTAVGAGALASAASAVPAAIAMPVRGSDASQPYFIDMLFRGASGTSNEADTKTTTGEAARILAQGLTQSEMSAGDKSYLAQLVARRTGLPQADAEIRVTQVTDAARLAATSAVAKAKEVAEAARRASAYLGLWVFVSLLFGAFCAAYAGTIGGRQRDTNAPLHGVI